MGQEMLIQKEAALSVAIGMYVGEPCRICGGIISVADIQAGAVFAGYSKCNKSRTAHKECWDKGVPQEDWAYS